MNVARGYVFAPSQTGSPGAARRQFFDHDLKGALAPVWMTEGVTPNFARDGSDDHRAPLVSSGRTAGSGRTADVGAGSTWSVPPANVDGSVLETRGRVFSAGGLYISSQITQSSYGYPHTGRIRSFGK